MGFNPWGGKESDTTEQITLELPMAVVSKALIPTCISTCCLNPLHPCCGRVALPAQSWHLSLYKGSSCLLTLPMKHCPKSWIPLNLLFCCNLR